MRIHDIMTTDIAVCTPDATLREVARLMVEKDCGVIPIVESLSNKRVIGIVTDRDLATRVIAANKNPATMQVHEVMSRPVAIIDPNADLDECVHSMEQHLVRRLPVVDGSGGCIGMVSQADIARRADDTHISELLHMISRRKPSLNALGTPRLSENSGRQIYF